MSRRQTSLRGRVSIDDVARAAGVSSMTVSRALNTPMLVSEETRKRVLSSADALGYVPNRIAGALRMQRSNVVAAIVPSIDNSLFSATLKGMADTLRTRGLCLMLGDAQLSTRAEEELIGAFLQQRPCAIALHASRHSARARTMLKAAAIPVVETGTLDGRPLDLAVSYSNVAAARAMVEHLVGRGYRRIGYIGLHSATNERATFRRRGYETALREAGLAYEPAMAFETGADLASGSAGLVALLNQAPGLDAVFCSGGVLAFGALLECNRQSIRVPDQLAIAGFDDHEMAQQLTPTVTTLRIPRRRIGEIAAELILQSLDGHPPATRRVDVGFELVPGGST